MMRKNNLRLNRAGNAFPSFFLLVILLLPIPGPSAPALAGDDFKEYRKNIYLEIERQKELIRKNPEDAEARFHLGLAYQAIGKHKEEMTAYKKAVELKPDFADAHYNLGITYDLYHDGENAIAHILKAEQVYREKRMPAQIRKTQRRLRLLSHKYSLKLEKFNSSQ